MFDRIPTPGQEGRVLITPEDGSPAYYAKVEMADNPSQVGTALNKAALLQDQTAALYGLGKDAVPDDVFAKLRNGGSFHIGDILATARTDLGDKWLPCDGSSVDTAAYPDLANLMLKKESGWEDKILPNSTQYWRVASLKYDATNKLYVAASTRSGSYDAYIHYASSLSGPWTRVKVGSSMQIFDMYCDNNIWVVVGYASGACIFVTDNKGVNWTKKTFSDLNALAIVTKFGDYYVAGCSKSNNYSNPTIVYTTTPTNPASWVTKTIDTNNSDNGGSLSSFACGDGKIVATSSQNYLYYTEDITGSWSRTLFTPKTSTNYRPHSVAYGNGYWCLSGFSLKKIAYSQDLVNWSENDIPVVSNEDGPCPYVSFYDGVWFTYGRKTTGNKPIINTAYVTPAGIWTYTELDIAMYSYCSLGSNGLILIGGQIMDSYVENLIWTTVSKKVPNIPITDGVYTYIKALV